MLKQARSTKSGMRLQTQDGRWRVKRVREYLQQVDKFLELLLGYSHIKDRQPR